ncbi:MAG: molybdopterin dinucleotide binding domain-containing protein [archaeon]|nr:molybdopterin dinucleotide binding domain-containing protein [archaeon]
MEGIKVKLISGRTIAQGENLENKMSEEYFNAVAICELNEADMARLGVSPDENVKVKTKYGEVVVKAKKAKGYPEGIAFIPMGPWANAVVSANTKGAGMPSFKDLSAEIEKTEEKVLQVIDLMRRYKEEA